MESLSSQQSVLCLERWEIGASSFSRIVACVYRKSWALQALVLRDGQGEVCSRAYYFYG